MAVSTTMPETKKKSEETRNRIAILENGYRAILELIDEMEQLSEFQDKIDIRSEIGQIWKVFLDDIGNLIEIEVCALFLVDEETHEFVLREVSPKNKGPFCRKEIDLQIESGMFSWIINRRKAAIVPSQVFRDKKSIIMLPLVTIRRTPGVILVLTPIKKSSITQENLKLLTMLTRQCSLVMENTLLYEHLRKEHESLKSAQAQILQAEKLASIGRLTAGASHEILNPLNIISGHIQFLLMAKNLDPRTEKYLNLMRDQSDRIARIVKSLLQFSQDRRAKNEEVNINELISRFVSMVEKEPRYHGIHINKELDDNMPSVMGNEDNLLQVFFHLLSNARDAMPGGGAINISTKLSTGNNQLEGRSRFMEIRFQDTGCGIPREDLDKVFDPFFTGKKFENGTGLGLSLSYGIIQDHGGVFKVESMVNEGACFTIFLPLFTKNS